MPMVNGDHLTIKNHSTDTAAAEVHQKTSGTSNVDALVVRQWGTSGTGRGLVIRSSNLDAPVFAIEPPSGGEAQRLGGTMTIAASPDATAPSSLPHGYGSSSGPTGLVISSSYPSDDTPGGTDGTGRLNLYSYQRANTYSFGENIRHFLMRSDAKSMQAYYMPVVSATDKSGYVAATRDPMADGVQWRPISWTGSHFEANDHNSIHGHWELEIPDSSGALQGRLEVPFIDQTNDADNDIDDVTIGVDYTNIRTNLADFSVRAQNISSGPFSGQTTCLRVGGANDRSKEIHLSISSDMSNSFRRWVLRANTETESTGNVGTNFQIARYDDTGTFIDTPVSITRSTGVVAIGGASGSSGGLTVTRSSGIALTVTPLATGGQAVLVTGTDTTASAYQGNVSGDSVNRYRVYVDGKIEWGPGNASRDTNLYRSAANTLKTDDKLITAVGLGVGNSVAATTLGAVTRKMEIFDASGSSLGFVPVYDAIT